VQSAPKYCIFTHKLLPTPITLVCLLHPDSGNATDTLKTLQCASHLIVFSCDQAVSLDFVVTGLNNNYTY